MLLNLMALRYNPELIPELERDPFETPDEFAARLAERPWYVGDGELRKAEYDIESGRFPLSVQRLQTWTKSWVDPSGSYSLNLPRDQARDLYQLGATWPLYARLVVCETLVSLDSLGLMVLDREMPIEIHLSERTDNNIDMTLTGHMISGRYRDLGNGTLLDTLTRLQWMRFAMGQRWDGKRSIDFAHAMIWERIFNQVAEFNQKGGFARHSDWRVPTIDELKTLILKKHQPAIDLQAFPLEVEAWLLPYWSSTSHASPRYSNRAWFVDFNRGDVDYYDKNSCKYLFFVRGGQ